MGMQCKRAAWSSSSAMHCARGEPASQPTHETAVPFRTAQGQPGPQAARAARSATQGGRGLGPRPSAAAPPPPPPPSTPPDVPRSKEATQSGRGLGPRPAVAAPPPPPSSPPDVPRSTHATPLPSLHGDSRSTHYGWIRCEVVQAAGECGTCRSVERTGLRPVRQPGSPGYMEPYPPLPAYSKDPAPNLDGITHSPFPLMGSVYPHCM